MEALAQVTWNLMVIRMSNKRMKDKAPVKKRSGPSPEILRKGAPHRDRSKYNRKQKHGKVETEDV